MFLLQLSAEAEKEIDYENVSFLRVLKLNKPEWKSVTLASLCALLSGFAMPLLAVIFGDFIGVSVLPASTYKIQIEIALHIFRGEEYSLASKIHLLYSV